MQSKNPSAFVHFFKRRMQSLHHNKKRPAILEDNFRYLLDNYLFMSNYMKHINNFLPTNGYEKSLKV